MNDEELVLVGAALVADEAEGLVVALWLALHVGNEEG